MARYFPCLVCMSLLLVDLGCSKGEPANPKPGGAPEQVGAAKKEGRTGVLRKIDILQAQQIMRQLGLAYLNYTTAHPRPPRKREDLAPFYENNPTINDALEKKLVVFIFNVAPTNMPAGASNTILAYEPEPDPNGNRVVLKADGRVEVLDDATFKKSPMAGR
jgi:hypothetical protein